MRNKENQVIKQGYWLNGNFSKNITQAESKIEGAINESKKFIE